MKANSLVLLALLGVTSANHNLELMDFESGDSPDRSELIE